MKTFNDYRIVRECSRRQAEARRENPARVIKLRTKWHKHNNIVSAFGESDDVHVFREDTLLVVLSINPRYGYIGAEVYDLSETEPDLIKLGSVCPVQVSEVFWQNATEDLAEDFPRGNVFDYSPMAIAKFALAALIDA
jgi:hypothetical protein